MFEHWNLSSIILFMFACLYIGGIIYQIVFEDKTAHRVDVMRYRMQKMERDSLIRKITN